jgi:hypothetical protein
MISVKQAGVIGGYAEKQAVSLYDITNAGVWPAFSRHGFDANAYMKILHKYILQYECVHVLVFIFH